VLDWWESRLTKSGGIGAAREGSIWGLLSKLFGDVIGGDLKDVGACAAPVWGKRGDDVAETIPKDMSAPGA
jgi:hypothetical protein